MESIMNPKIDQPIIDLLAENLNLKETLKKRDDEIKELKAAGEKIVEYYHSIDHRFELFKSAVIKLKHLINL